MEMEFNPDPTKQAREVLFTRKISSLTHPPLFFNNIEVSKVNEHTHLGIILDSKLTFINHITEKIKIARKRISLIKYFSTSLPLRTLDQMYKLLVRPHFDYCDVIYHIPPLNGINGQLSLNFLMERIEKIQYQAALAVSGCWQGSNRNKLYEQLGWESLSDRRWHRRLSQLYKIYNNLTPNYLRENLPEIRQYHVLNNFTFQPEICRTAKYRNSFFPDSVEKWNYDIINDFKTCELIQTFKDKIIKLVRQPPKALSGGRNLQKKGVSCTFSE